MKKQLTFLSLLLLVAFLTAWAGCTSAPPAPTPPPTTPITTSPVTTTIAPPTTTMPPMIATPAPATTMPTATKTTTQAAGGKTVQVTLIAQHIAFDQSTITVPAGARVVMTFMNLDDGVPHNFALYTDLHATTSLFIGDFITGVRTVTYTFTAPSTPGSYFFRCDVHPETMTGTLVTT